MKELFAGIVLILVLGFGVFFYRNILERPDRGSEAVACTFEAKLCPDGSSVGRTGLSCEFAPCAYPNVEVSDAHLAFAVPEGYTPNEEAYGADPSLIAAFEKGTSRITVRRYGIDEGETAEEVILAHTVHETSGETPKSLSEFDTVLAGGHTYRSFQIDRFEGQVATLYWLIRTTDVLSFSISEGGVSEWTNPELKVSELPEHRALLRMLATVQADELLNE